MPGNDDNKIMPMKSNLLTLFINGDYEECLITSLKLLEVDCSWDHAALMTVSCLQAYNFLSAEQSRTIIDTIFSLGKIAIAKKFAKILAQNGKHEIARIWLQQLHLLDQEDPFILNNLGALNLIEGSLSQAEKCLKAAFVLSPTNNHICRNLCILYMKQHKPENERKIIDNMLKYNPKNLGLLLRRVNLALSEVNHKVAIAEIHTIIKLYPKSSDAYFALSQAYQRNNKTVPLSNAFRLVYRYRKATDWEHIIESQCALILWLVERKEYEYAFNIADLEECIATRRYLRLLVLPILYSTTSEIKKYRDIWRTEAIKLLNYLQNNVLTKSQKECIYHLAWRVDNFFLSYQMENDRELNEIYALILEKSISYRLRKFINPVQKHTLNNNTPKKVGVISPHLRNLSGTKMFIGLFDELKIDNNFDVYLYNLKPPEDDVTKDFAALGHYKYLPVSKSNASNVFEKIIADELDILIFLDIGMNPISRIISILRFAPIQLMMWGHPVTSGSRAIDYFVSSRLMEPSNNDDHYTERIVYLNSIGLNYKLQSQNVVDTLQIGTEILDRSRPIISSCQSIYKYSPKYDWIFAELAFYVSNVQFIFIESKFSFLNDLRRQRFKFHFDKLGLDMTRHIIFLPSVRQQMYIKLFGVCHHALDTIDWNGGNTSIQALIMNCPVVSLPGDYLRGRHTFAMLKLLDLDELIARDLDNYLEISYRLITNKVFYTSVKEKLASRSAQLIDQHNIAVEFKDIISNLLSLNF